MPASRRRLTSLAAYGLFALCLVAAGVAIVSRGSQLTQALQRLSPLSLLGSFAAGSLGVLAMYGSWLAAVRDGGVVLSRRNGLAIYGIGQVGKYLPGSVWPVVTQAALGSRLGISRLRMASGSLLALAVGVAEALVLGCVLLPFSSAHAARQLWWAPLLALPMVIALVPAVLNRLVGLAARLLRRPQPDSAYTLGGILRSAGWALLGNLLFGLHVLLLGQPFGLDDPRGYLLSVCAFALAAGAGVLVVFAPAGAGAREAVLTAVLAPVLTVDAALAVTLVSRLVLVLADVMLAVSQLRGMSRSDRRQLVEPSRSST